MAAESGREVFALPGSIHNPMARGCHRLIRQGVGLAETPGEVIEALAPLAENLAGALRGRLEARESRDIGNFDFGSDPTQVRAVWQALGHDPVNLDQLAQRTGLTVGPLSAMLLAMELDGRISAEHGRYSRCP
jgi:DNA processing protein